MYKVYQLFPDGKRFFMFENDDRFECEVYVSHHRYDYNNRRSKLIIEFEQTTNKKSKLQTLKNL